MRCSVIVSAARTAHADLTFSAHNAPAVKLPYVPISVSALFRMPLMEWPRIVNQNGAV
jgi:hypothetical protein